MEPFVVVMGVSGCGKSLIGCRLAAALGVVYVDADDLHPDSNIDKMSAGEPLTDEDRWPWLDRVGREGATLRDSAGGVVVACSALKRAYRDILRLHGVTQFFHLAGDESLIAERMKKRDGHFMSDSMLTSQFDTLEVPGPDEEDVYTLSIVDTPEGLVDTAVEVLE